MFINLTENFQTRCCLTRVKIILLNIVTRCVVYLVGQYSVAAAPNPVCGWLQEVHFSLTSTINYFILNITKLKMKISITAYYLYIKILNISHCQILMVSNLIEYILKSVIHKEINNVFLFCKITKVLKKTNFKNNLLLSS